MIQSWPVFALAMLLTATASVTTADAAPITEREKRDCKKEYKAYCDGLEVGSQPMRACMRKVRHSLSDRCIDALIDAGEVGSDMGEKLKDKN